MLKIPSHFQEFLSQPRRICLINHFNPDGDAVGSTFGLGSALQKMGHEVSIVMPNAFPDFLKFLRTNVPVLIYTDQREEADRRLGASEVIGTLDFNQPDRCGAELGKWLTARDRPIFMIDHHQQPGSFADPMFSFPDVASTCELVFEWLDALNALENIDVDAAQALYTGMVTDTGSFRFPSVRPKTLEIAAELMRMGARPHQIHEQIYDSNRESRLRLLGHCLNGMQLRSDLRAVFMHLDATTLGSCGFSKGDTEGFVNQGLSIEGIDLSLFAMEREDGWKISLRSRGDLDVSALAREHFNGGGHINAAGGESEGPAEVIREKLWNILSR